MSSLHPLPRRSRALALALLAFAAACAVKDVQKPLPPTVDAPVKRTSHLTVLVTGSAEPGAEIAILRTPAFPDGATLDKVVADPSTARFSVVLPLAKNRTNHFSFSAIDANGLTSDPTELEIIQSESELAGVSLLLERSRVTLDADGNAALHARAEIALTEEGSRAGRAVLFQVEDYVPAISEVTATTDEDGVALATIPGLSRLGRGRVVATALGSATPDVAAFEVLAGEPSSATLELAAVVDGAAVSGTTLNVTAGTEVEVRVVARDAGANVVSAPALVTTSPAGAFVAGSLIRFTTPGTYTVTALALRSDGAASPFATGTVTVAAQTGGTTSVLRLEVSVPASVTSGTAFPFEAKLLDPLGNPVTATALTATLSDPAGTFDAANRRLTLAAAGDSTITLKANRGDGVLVSSAPVTVRVLPGAAASLALTLDGTAAPLTTPRAVGPRAELAVAATVKDAAGNAIPDAPVSLAVDASATVFGSTVLAPSRTGTYTIVGAVPGTAVRGLAAFTVVAATPDDLVTTCPATAAAGAAFTCTASVVDAGGNLLPVTVQWAALPTSGVVIAGSRVTIERAGLTRLTATANGVSRTRTHAVVVRPGPAATVRLTLSPENIAVGKTVTATTSVVDAFQNALAIPVTLSTDAPDAIAGTSELRNFTTPGSWHVFARTLAAAGQPSVSAVANLAVTAEAPSSLALTVTPATTFTGAPVTVATVARDPFGNVVAGSGVVVTVNGAAPDQRTVLSTGATLTFLEAGTYRVAATLGAATASQVVDVRRAADVSAPQLSTSIEGAVRGGPQPIFKPGVTVTVTLRARDDRALGGYRLRASSAALGTLLDTDVEFAEPRAELEKAFQIVLPATRVGDLTITASVVDTAGNAASALPLDLTSDAHVDRVVLTASAPAAAFVRSVSVDPALNEPVALAVADGKLYVSDVRAPIAAVTPGSTADVVGAGGLVTALWNFGTNGLELGLAALPISTGGGSYLFSSALTPTSAQTMVFRLAPGLATPQAYTSPALTTNSALLPGGLAIDVRAAAASRLLYTIERSADDNAALQGRLWSMPARDAQVASVDPTGASGKQAFSVDLAAHRPLSICLPDVATPTELYFTGTRFTGAGAGRLAFSGVYKVSLQTTVAPGHVPAAAVPVTVFEEPRDPAGLPRVNYGSCVHAAVGTTTVNRVVFARWTETGAAPTYAGGRISSVVSTCNGACTPADLVTGTATLPLGPLALVRGQAGLPGGTTSLFVAEPGGARQIFRVDGFF